MTAERKVTAAPLGLVTDDVTGLLDTLVHFARAGLKTTAFLHPLTGELGVLGDPNDVVGISTNSRDGDLDDARRSTAAALAQLRASGTGSVFCKVDSLLRGHVGAAVAACASGASGAVVVATALPAEGRRTRGGRQVLERAEQEQQPEPQPIGDVHEIIRAAGLELVVVGLDQVRLDGGAALTSPFLHQPGVALVFDAETDADLDGIVAAHTGRVHCWVGTAGLGRALAGSLGTDAGDASTVIAARLEHSPLAATGGCLVVIGSASAGAAAQAGVLAHQRGVDVETFLGRDSPLTAGLLRRARAELEAGDTVVVMPPAPGPGAVLHGGVADDLARTVAPLADAARIVVVVGGATAHSLFSALAISALDVIGPAPHGGAVVAAPSAGGPLYVTRSGSFGTVDALVEILDEIDEAQPARRIR